MNVRIRVNGPMAAPAALQLARAAIARTGRGAQGAALPFTPPPVSARPRGRPFLF